MITVDKENALVAHMASVHNNERNNEEVNIAAMYLETELHKENVIDNNQQVIKVEYQEPSEECSTQIELPNNQGTAISLGFAFYFDYRIGLNTTPLLNTTSPLENVNRTP